MWVASVRQQENVGCLWEALPQFWGSTAFTQDWPVHGLL
jgi:hypothetical protein